MAAGAEEREATTRCSSVTWEWLDFGTAVLWLVLALVGIGLRIRRLLIYRSLVATTPADQAYLASIKRSTYFRLSVKLVLLVGAVAAVLGVVVPPVATRVGILIMLILMLSETSIVDAIRARLGREQAEEV